MESAVTPLFAQLRALLLLLQPRVGGARTWWGVAVGALGLLIAARSFGDQELIDRLLGSVWLLFAATGMAATRRAAWFPDRHDLLPLPVSRHQRMVVELGGFLLLAVLGASLLILLSAGGSQWLASATHELRRDPDLEGQFLHLARATLLLLPLLLATAMGESRWARQAVQRLLLPWLPLGIAACSGWLEHALGVSVTLATMLAVAVLSRSLLRLQPGTLLLFLEPLLPGRDGPHSRSALPPAERLTADLHRGLGKGLAWGAGLAGLGWVTLSIGGRGVLLDGTQVMGILLVAAGFLVAAMSTLDIPLLARFPGWRPPRLPWTMLPLRPGRFQGAMHAHHSLVWLALVPLNLVALTATYQGEPPNLARFGAYEVMLGMLVVMIPVLACWEGIFTDSSRPPAGLGPRLLLATLGVASVQLPFLFAALLSDTAGGLDLAEPLGWSTAVHRVLLTQTLPVLLGLAWLAAGRSLIRRQQPALTPPGS